MIRKKLSQEVAAERVAAKGYELLGKYIGANEPVLVRCSKHNFEKKVYVKHFTRGVMACCFAEAQRNRMIGNTICLGKRLSEERKIAVGNRFRGKKLSPDQIEKSRKGRTGLKRSAQFSAHQSEWLREKARNIDYIIDRARNGKTSGKKGFFYIANVGSLLKFGSTNKTIDYRISRLRTSDGYADLLLCVQVDDAGGYEAAMMDKCRDHWSHGEYFNKSVLESKLRPQIDL